MKYSSHVHPVAAVGKRLLDLLLAGVGLLLLAPLFPVVALAIKLDSPGPVFFQQARIGRAWPGFVEIFMMTKFRTMKVDAEKNGVPQWAKKQDPRITRVGMWLRKTRLDELPQLINVIRGEMSIVGPRPERPGFYHQLETAIPFYCERTFGVSPGITGLAQVNQGYDESIEDVRSKVGYDHAYALALSHPLSWLRVEMTILFKTVAVVALGRGQ